MTEPTVPPPAATPQKKKTSPWIWVLVGCLGLLILIGGACAITGMFVAKKVKDVAEDFEKDPVRKAAELAVSLNPELELVEGDEQAGTLTVRNKTTGEVATFDYGELAEGRFGWETEEGEFRVDATEGEGGTVTVTTPEGETRYGAGAGAGELPSWVPVYPGASESQATFSSRSGEGVTGMWTLGTDDAVEQVKSYYESKLEDEGYAVTVQTFSGGEGEMAVVTGTREDPDRQVSVTVNREGGRTQAVIQYSGPE